MCGRRRRVARPRSSRREEDCAALRGTPRSAQASRQCHWLCRRPRARKSGASHRTPEPLCRLWRYLFLKTQDRRTVRSHFWLLCDIDTQTHKRRGSWQRKRAGSRASRYSFRLCRALRESDNTSLLVLRQETDAPADWPARDTTGCNRAVPSRSLECLLLRNPRSLPHSDRLLEAFFRALSQVSADASTFLRPSADHARPADVPTPSARVGDIFSSHR